MLVHVSFENVVEFKLRVPSQRSPKENDSIKRICMSTDIIHAIHAIPQAGEVLKYFIQELKVKPFLYVYYLDEKDIRYTFIPKGIRNLNALPVMHPLDVSKYVEDAIATKEHWLLQEPGNILKLKTYKVNTAIFEDYTDAYGVGTVKVPFIDYTEVNDIPIHGNYSFIVKHKNNRLSDEDIITLKSFGIRNIIYTLASEQFTLS